MPKIIQLGGVAELGGSGGGDGNWGQVYLGIAQTIQCFPSRQEWPQNVQAIQYPGLMIVIKYIKLEYNLGTTMLYLLIS